MYCEVTAENFEASKQSKEVDYVEKVPGILIIVFP